VLPPRYRSSPIFFRRPPRLDPALVEEEHLLAMRELAIRPATYDDLKAQLEISDATLARTLAALYYVGSITTNRARATPTTVAAELRRGSRDGELRPGEAPLELADLRQLTAPAPLVLT
jgi:DNA-binding transcriptional ArsR family regulator